MRKFKLYYISLLILLPASAWAQLAEYPIERGSTTSARSSSTPSAREHVLNLVSLPFWDDFSTATGGLADSLRWINNNKVLVNSGQAINPPTINVATFDGLNEFGTPYTASPTDILDFGYRDTLESQPIKMTEVLPGAPRNTVFLSFFYQAGGNGEPPDPNDFLRLEFKTNTGKDTTIATFRVTDLQPNVFYDTLIRINQNKFYHNNFRFRFISFGRKSGRYDAWHVDYVYLNKGRNSSDNSYPDRSLSTLPKTMFGKYYSIPLKHFLKQPEINTTSFYIRNLFDSATVLNYNTYLKSKKNYTNSSDSTSITLDFETPLFVTNGTVFAKELREVFIETLPDPTNSAIFNPAAKGIELTMTVLLNSQDNNPVADYDANYIPIDFRWNDTTQVHYFLDSVYAYDDGMAEHAAGLTTQNNQLAYRFEGNVGQDSIINGVEIYYPYFAGVSANSMQFFIFDCVNGKPGTLLYEESIAVIRSANNEFQTFDLYQGQGVIVQDTFFLGYREPSSGRVRIGLDKSNDTGDRMFYKLTETGNWQLNDRVTGSLMMRPRFGPGSTVVGLPETKRPISLYPNPNAGAFYVRGQAEQLQVFTITGQLVDFSAEDVGEEEKRINVHTSSSGLYILRYKSGARIFTEKIIISR